MFIEASRKKLKIVVTGMHLPIEQIWDKSLSELSASYSCIQELKKASLFSLLDTSEDTLNLQAEIVRHIFTVKKREQSLFYLIKRFILAFLPISSNLMKELAMLPENVFEYAARYKMRFPFKGRITVEDLWDLSLEELDVVYITLKAKEKATTGTESLLTTVPANDTLSIKIAIVKHIFDVKMAEREAGKLALEKTRRKEYLLSILAEKQDDELRGKTPEELEAMINEL